MANSLGRGIWNGNGIMTWTAGRRDFVRGVAVFGLAAPMVGTLVSRARADVPPIIGATTRLWPEVGARLGDADRSLIIGDHVFKNDLLWTGTGGKLQVTLKDGTVLRLGGNAKVALDDFAYQEDDSTVALALRSIAGAFRFIGGEIDRQAPGSTRIATPLATLTIRGTDIFAGPIDGAYGVFVFAGEIQVATDAGSVSLKAGDGTTLTARQAAPGPVKRWPEAKIRRAEAITGL